MSNAQQINPAQQNELARRIITSQAVERLQSIFSQTFNTDNQTVVNINPRNVGLIKGFFIDVETTFVGNETAAAALSAFGVANLLHQIKFDDLQNNTRVQTSGWHLHLINSVRNQRPFGLSMALENSPIDYGAIYSVISAPATIGFNETVTAKMRYYLPLAYSNSDLRGAVYANVVNATMQITLTINKNFALAANNPDPRSVYNVTAGAVAMTNCKITVYQHYLDQLPVGQQGPILPMLDIQTIYELKDTTMTGIAPTQDFTVPYANFRTFLSTTAIYWEGGNTLAPGTDINYWALRSANFTDIFKYEPNVGALLTRLQIGTDVPTGSYYFSHRERPISTIQYGNMELVINASQADAGTQLFIGYEDFAMINIVSGAGSLPAGG